LSIPWGQVRRDDEIGGYHLIWPRDLVAIMSGLMAAGEYDTPLRGLIYLAAGQRDDGGFHQNTWIDGRPYWNGIQLDEVAFPVLLAWRLQQADALGCFDPYPMVRSAAKYLVLNGPDTPQDRWEECSGFCPSTLAVQIAALVCAGCMARQRGEPALADYFIGHADFLEQHIEEWTVTERGELHEEIPRHYVRVLPTDPQQCERPDQIDDLTVTVDNRPGMPPREFLARNMVDPSFLELVRYGIRRSDDPLIVDSLRVVDHVLRVGTPGGPCWRRYNHDGHGQRDDGGPLENGGRGRAWTLLTAERGMYELAAGAESDTHIRAMEFFSGPAGLLPEQVWDGPDLPESHLECGKATGSATPLVWAHAEYVKLLRSRSEERIFDRIDVVHQRYCEECEAPPRVQIWQDNSRPSRVRGDETLRVQLRTPFQLRWHDPSQESMRSTDSVRVDDDLHYADLRPDSRPQGRLQFELQWQSQPDEPDSRECTAKFSIDCSSPRAGG
jgi:glucoamylase